MTLMSDAKFEKILAFHSKNDMMNFVNFNMGSSKSENLHFGVLLFLIAYKVLAKKNAEGLSLLTLTSDPNFKEKLTFCVKNDVNILVNFNSSNRKSENVHFDRIFLSKVCNI